MRYDERTEAQIRRDLRRKFPGHPVPAHPLTGRTERYHQEQDRLAEEMVRRVVTVVIMALGREPVELPVEAHHRCGVWP